mgnify:FL=1
MKGLGQFRRFDWDGFSRDKIFQVVAIADWKDRETGKRLGKKIDVVISKDETPYEFRNGEQFTNRVSRLSFKTEGNVDNIAIEDTVIPVEATARCYGEYNNDLSITCKGIRVVYPQPTGQKSKEQ